MSSNQCQLETVASRDGCEKKTCGRREENQRATAESAFLKVLSRGTDKTRTFSMADPYTLR